MCFITYNYILLLNSNTILLPNKLIQKTMKAFRKLAALLSILSFISSFYNEPAGRIVHGVGEITIHTLALSLVFFLCYKGLDYTIKEEAKPVINK